MITGTQSKTLDYGYGGQPFVLLDLRTNKNSSNLDVGYMGQPFVALPDSTNPVEPTYNPTQMFAIF